MADPSPIPPPAGGGAGESTRDARPDGAAVRSEPPRAGTRRPVLWPTPESPEPAARLAELRRDWQARLKPIDEAERAAVDAIVGSVRRRVLLERAELRVLGGLAEGRVEPGMPSLATLGRHAARIERDRALAERELRDLYRLRPVPIPRPDLNPERLEWLAAHVRRRAIESAEALAATLAAHAAAPVAAPAPPAEAGGRPPPAEPGGAAAAAPTARPATDPDRQPGPAVARPAVAPVGEPERVAGSGGGRAAEAARGPVPAAVEARPAPAAAGASETGGGAEPAAARDASDGPLAAALRPPGQAPTARSHWLGSTSPLARLAPGLAAGG